LKNNNGFSERKNFKQYECKAHEVKRITEELQTLDVGCGDKKQGDVGCDLRRLKDVDVICDMNHLPFKNNCFAKVHSSAVIEHSPHPFLFLQEQVRVLMKNGKLICEADNARYWRFHINFTWFEEDFVTHFRSSIYSPSDEHYMIFYPECINRMLSIVNLRNIKSTHIAPRKPLDKIIATFFPMAYRNMCSRFITTAEKMK
jgi:SAM-dependent methyltransferase